MAFSIKMRGVPARDGIPGWSSDNLSWWDMNLLRESLPVREIVDKTLYRDYVVILTPAEALDWNLRFGTSYRAAGGRSGTVEDSAIDELTRKLESEADTLRWVVVEQYEWESGL